MGKFRIKMKLQGLELEIEGSRDDVPIISHNIGQQMAALLQPAGAIVEGESTSSNQGSTQAISDETGAGRIKQRKRRPGGATNSGQSPEVVEVDWKHDPAKYGSPRQSWNTAQKAMWVLYVVGEELGTKELSAGVIARTFKKHFKQAGIIAGSNVSRDLGKQKMSSPATVGEDTTKNPSVWFLTDEGRKQTQVLIAEALKQPT
jgi:hypothetical protein